MKIKIPAKTLEVCDNCQRDGYLETCIVCGDKYCLLCRGLVSACGIECDICKKCSRLDDVIAIVQEWGRQFSPIVHKRDAALRRLGRRMKGKAKEPKEAT